MATRNRISTRELQRPIFRRWKTADCLCVVSIETITFLFFRSILFYVSKQRDALFGSCTRRHIILYMSVVAIYCEADCPLYCNGSMHAISSIDFFYHLYILFSLLQMRTSCEKNYTEMKKAGRQGGYAFFRSPSVLGQRFSSFCVRPLSVALSNPWYDVLISGLKILNFFTFSKANKTFLHCKHCMF